MEAVGEWSSSLGGMYTFAAEEADFMNQLLASYDQPSGTVATGDHDGSQWNVDSHHQLRLTPTSYYTGLCFSQESSSYSAANSGYYAVVLPQGETDNNNNNNNNNNNECSTDFGTEDVTINTNLYLVGEETSECDVTEYSGKNILPMETNDHKSKKRSRPTLADKNKRVTKGRKIQKTVEMSDDNNNHDEEEQTGKRKAVQPKVNKSSITCCSDEDDSNGGPQEIDVSSSKEGDGDGDRDSKALNLNGKTRASRGAATDPQSLYARKRRERINERLRILQNLVPNGTKVDISTMLEEAVHYVKFLQLQIKLLSSDEMWMYAPIAYNGMDIGLDLKLNSLT